MIKILFICHGNICRSTLAESLFTYLVHEEGLEAFFEIASCATSREEIGNGPHRGTIKELQKHRIPVVPHRARQMTKEDYSKYDLLIGMDEENIWNMRRIAGGDPEGKIKKLLSFSGSGRDVADPWYTGDFETTYEDILEGCTALLHQLKKKCFVS